MTTRSALLTGTDFLVHSSRDDEERRFMVHVFDYLRENAIGGDIHEYGCDHRPLLPIIASVAKSVSLAGTKMFGFGSFEPPRVIPGRGPKSDAPFDTFVPREALEGATGGLATIQAGPIAKILSRSERDRFISFQNKVAMAIVHASSIGDAKMIFDFVEVLLTEGSVIYFADLFAGYRRTPAKEIGRAFVEFQEYSRFKYLRHMNVGWWGRSYITCLPTDMTFEKL